MSGHASAHRGHVDCQARSVPTTAPTYIDVPAGADSPPAKVWAGTLGLAFTCAVSGDAQPPNRMISTKAAIPAHCDRAPRSIAPVPLRGPGFPPAVASVRLTNAFVISTFTSMSWTRDGYRFADDCVPAVRVTEARAQLNSVSFP